MNKKNNTLLRTNEVALHAACQVMRSGPFATHLQPGVMLRIRRLSPFKAVVYWYAITGDGRYLLDDYLSENSVEYFVVDRAWTRWTYKWHQIRLGDKMYLRPLGDSDMISRRLRLLKTRDVLI